MSALPSFGRRTVRRKQTRAGRAAVWNHPLRRALLWMLFSVILAAAGWSAWVVHEINLVASQDGAEPADAIAVFGAAQYAGRPSPVYHARLDHAAALYNRQIAPLVITFGGGADKNSGRSEGGVGRDYLLAQGVPYDRIIAETESTSTAQQVALLAQIAEEHELRHIVVVSDNTHLFRIRELCRRQGLDVSTSPRPALGHIDRLELWSRYFHEVLSYTALRLGLTQTWQWVEGQPA